jgi:DNA-binding response OmpR family regulator
VSSPARILVVEDEPNVRLVFRTALESAGYEVDEAEDGESALRRLDESPCDLVLLDLLMPRVGGMEVLRRLRDGGDDVPVVIVTAHGTIPDAVLAMKLGAIDFVTKPLTPDALRRVASDVLLRHRPTSLDSLRPRTEHATSVTVAPPAVDLMPAKRALNRRDFEEAAELLEEALDLDPASAEAHTLMGVLQECRGQDHAAYHSYKAALAADPHFGPALNNMKRYCDRFGLDFQSKAINPAAEA